MRSAFAVYLFARELVVVMVLGVIYATVVCIDYVLAWVNGDD